MKRNKDRILLCVTGGIAAYKAIDLASLLIKQGYEVKTILTRNALEFVTALNFKAITHNGAYSDMFGGAQQRNYAANDTDQLAAAQDKSGGTFHGSEVTDNAGSDPIPHISLADWADLMVIAPATANIMAKSVYGIADDLLSTVLLAHSKPVLWIPAMNVHMLAHPATQANMVLLKERGNYVMEPSTGMLACGYDGKGKYPPNEEILYAIKTYLVHTQDLKGAKVLITAGATAEPIDAMRTITNRSSGKMGMALARAATLRGAEVTLVYGNISVSIPYYLQKAIHAPTVKAMHTAVNNEAATMDIIIMAAAVSDFAPAVQITSKLKKTAKLTLELQQTIDILAELGKRKAAQQVLIGFAAETENLVTNAQAKLLKKNLDLIIANHLDVSGQDETEIHLITGTDTQTIRTDKFTAAHLIWDKIRAIKL